jgi:hypothetical protein
VKSCLEVFLGDERISDVEIKIGFRAHTALNQKAVDIETSSSSSHSIHPSSTRPN